MIRDLYMAALTNNHQSLVLLIDLVVNEKKMLTLEDDERKLKYFFKEQFSEKMSQHLEEYNKVKKIVTATNEVNVFQIRFHNTFFYVAAHTKEEAKEFFLKDYPELHEIRVELPELEVEGEDGLHTLKHHILKTKSFPAILGYWTL